MNCDEAIVLVGGLGTRLRDVVSDVPKPLAPVAGRPFLGWVLDQLAENGIRHVVLAAGHMAQMIQDFAGRQWKGMSIVYSIEAQALGTGGAISQARGQLHGDCAHVLNGDTFLRYQPAALEAATRAAGAQIGVALARVDDLTRYGAVECDGPLVSAFLEKGRSGPGLINAGCYFLGSQALRSLPDQTRYSFETEVLVPMVASGRVAGYADTADFIDIGVPDDYRRAQSKFALQP